MANTTFNGPVRSENGFTVVSKNSSTGAFTTSFTLDGSGMQIAPVSLADAASTNLTAAANAGRINLVGDNSQDSTYVLPAPTAGIFYRFVYAGGAADGTDALIITPGNSNFYIGGVTFLDTDGDAISSVFSNGSSNSSIQMNVPAGFDITILGLNTTNYQIFGNVTSTTAPAFADQ